MGNNKYPIANLTLYNFVQIFYLSALDLTVLLPFFGPIYPIPAADTIIGATRALLVIR